MSAGRVLHAWGNLSANVRGAGFVIVGALTLIIMAALVKHLGQSLPAFEVLFVRFLAGLIVILPVVWRQGFAILRTDKLRLHMARGFVGFLGNLCFFFALINMVIADAVTIQFSRPLILVIIAGFFLGEAVGMRRGVVTCIGFTGVLIITQPFAAGFEPWALVAVGGALFGSFVVILIKLLSRTERTLVIMFYFALFTTLFSFIPALMVWQTPTWTEVALLILTGVLGIVGQSLYTHGIVLGETSYVMPFDYLRIVYSFILGALWFGEAPGIWSYAGAAVIIVSNIYLLRGEAKPGGGGR